MTCIGQRTAVQSMAHFFCRALVRSRKTINGSDNDRCQLALTQDLLADILGISPVHVNRALGQLRSMRLANLHKSELVVYDFDRMADLAEFDEVYLAPI